MLRPGGQAEWTSPEGGTVGCDTFTCCHCNKVVFVKPRAAASDMGGWCANCAGAVCPHCAGKNCTPFEKRLEAYEQKHARQRQLDSILSEVGT